MLAFSSFFPEFSSVSPEDLRLSDPFDFGIFKEELLKFSVDPEAFDEPADCAESFDFDDVFLSIDGDGLKDRDVRWLNFSKFDGLDDVGTCDLDALAAFSAANAFLEF